MVAGESLGTVFPISVSFVQGEQPASGKFSGWANQTSAGLNRLARAIGDLWGEEFEDNKLYVATQRPAHIINLARLIGPASAINPLRPVSPVQRVEYDVELVPDDIPIKVNEFNLREDCDCEPPIEYDLDYPSNGIMVHYTIETVLEFISTTKGDTAFQTRVLLRTQVNSTGKYYVDTHGNVLTYDRTDDYSTVPPSASTTYKTQMVPDMYDQATLNVIPDMNQSTTDGLCDVLDENDDVTIPSGEFVIRTPFLVKLSRRDSNNNPLEPGDTGCPPVDFATKERARLPYVLKASDGMNLNDGDQIPDGFVGLWDETDKRMVSGLTFKMSDVGGYSSNYCIIATGGTLTRGSSRYRIVTVGTSITEALANTIRRLDIHTHNTRESGFPVWHKNLYNKTILPWDVSDKWSIEVSSPPSIIPGSDHPQYLCRYGWIDGIDAGQHDNAMLGDIFMAVEKSDYTNGVYQDSTTGSRRIRFGDLANGPALAFNPAYSGLHLFSNGTYDSLRVDGDVDVGGDVDCTDVNCTDVNCTLVTSNRVNFTDEWWYIKKDGDGLKIVVNHPDDPDLYFGVMYGDLSAQVTLGDLKLQTFTGDVILDAASEIILDTSTITLVGSTIIDSPGNLDIQGDSIDMTLTDHSEKILMSYSGSANDRIEFYLSRFLTPTRYYPTLNFTRDGVSKNVYFQLNEEDDHEFLISGNCKLDFNFTGKIDIHNNNGDIEINAADDLLLYALGDNIGLTADTVGITSTSSITLDAGGALYLKGDAGVTISDDGSASAMVVDTDILIEADGFLQLKAVGSYIDFGWCEYAFIPVRSALPAGVAEGQFFYRNNRFYVWNGTNWDYFARTGTES